MENFKNFINDIRDLYCKTSIKEIERLFIRLAVGLERSISEDQILNALVKNNSVISQLQDPKVYIALLDLKEIKGILNDNVTVGDIVKIFTGSKYTKSLPYIPTFSVLLSNPSTQIILSPFKDIITLCPYKLQTGSINEKLVAEDLVKIYNSLAISQEPSSSKIPSQTKLTRSEKQKKMYGYLLYQFTNDISKAALNIAGQLNEPQKSQMNNFAKITPSIQNNVDLLRLGVYYNENIKDIIGSKELVNMSDQRLKNEAIKSGNYVLGHYNMADANGNYNYVKERAATYAGAFTVTDKSQGNISKYMTPEFWTGKYNEESLEIASINLDNAQVLNPRYISFLMYFFINLYGKVHK